MKIQEAKIVQKLTSLRACSWSEYNIYRTLAIRITCLLAKAKTRRLRGLLA